MENVKNICLMRELIRALREVESSLMEQTGSDLNQAMVLCVLADEPISASEIANRIGLLPAQTSKLLSAVENRGWIKRQFGQEDKRKMFFSLTAAGKKELDVLKKIELDIPAVLQPVFQAEEKR
ncbi:MarR family winged helix-turn-helix transcriptional regulator [Porphyromonas macacae]|uniref:Homoprotocatechuate degradation operon regulator, HpaR n=1 Tax=Porphyromonas macacae TaxID=28115 RepID=A0A379DFR8_9PORP|nr:winged helix DNA-binding protein [Porphyromonas macacae]SUB77181.1 homoprotocatechuate degradation operon regulator, HpaR [Porphyromonas macacae]